MTNAVTAPNLDDIDDFLDPSGRAQEIRRLLHQIDCDVSRALATLDDPAMGDYTRTGEYARHVWFICLCTQKLVWLGHGSTIQHTTGAQWSPVNGQLVRSRWVVTQNGLETITHE